MVSRLDSIDIPEEFMLSSKFTVIRKLGQGWEGEVYLVREVQTGIDRVAKIFYPQRNLNNRAALFYAKKLHKLRNCTVLIQYLTQDTFRFKGHALTYLVSEYVEGIPLSEFLDGQKGQRLHAFQGLHL
ncbi:MAG: serine/threonine protein kinase, partial [Bdellovibrionales bacterium]|nr:serine/threonine protein kinase [Bdellovibrionales bacterium]